MATTDAIAKSENDLRKEIDELQRQQRQITERLRDPRGLRRGRVVGPGPRNFATNGARQRPFTRPADHRNEEEEEDQPTSKRRLSSAVVRLEDGAVIDDAKATEAVNEENHLAKEAVSGDLQKSGWARRESFQKVPKKDSDIPSNDHVPRVLPKNDDPRLVNRNKRMLGQLLGTLERFRKEDEKLSGTEAFMRRSDSLQRAEQRAREESERLKQQEREKIAEKRRRDLTLRARVSAKTEEKKLELLFLRWSEHQKKLCNFIRTKAEPPIYYQPKKPFNEDPAVAERQKEQAFEEWKTARREELSEYQKQLGEQYLANVEKDLDRWQNARNRKANDDTLNLQETMDKELDTHRLEHGPKKRTIPSDEAEEEEDDVDDDIIAGEDDMMDDVLDNADDSSRRTDGTRRMAAADDDSSPNARKTG